MIVIDSLKKLKKPIKRCKYYAHLMSTRLNGTKELTEFVKGIGLDPKHIQYPREHYDVLGKGNYHKAIRAGAVQCRRVKFNEGGIEVEGNENLQDSTLNIKRGVEW